MKLDEIKSNLRLIGKYCDDEYNDIRVDDVVFNALDLISRQQAEIEALQMDNEQLQSDIVNANCNYEELHNTVTLMDDFVRSICNIRMSKGKLIANSEDLLTYIQEKECKAIKEFAEKVKQLFAEGDGAIIDIDNLLNKMAGKK